MQITKHFLLFSALAALGFAQDTSAAAVDTNTVTNTDTVSPTATTDSLSTRQSLVTNVNTNIILYTSVNTVVDTTSLPHSLDTRSRTIESTVVLTSIRVFTTNTLSDGRLSTGTATVAVPTGSESSTTSDISASSLTSSALGCKHTVGLFFPAAGVAIAAAGFAAGM